MKVLVSFLASLLAIFGGPLCAAQNPQSDSSNMIGKVLGHSVNHLRWTVLPLADAMPAEKYGFAPTGGEFHGVRTFAEQLKHVAASNYAFAAAILGEEPPAALGEDENGPASLKTKADIVKYLTESFVYAEKATSAINEKNVVSPIRNPFGDGTVTRLAMANLILGHGNDHYGQLVEYLRMNGIVPPASQQ